VTLAVAAGLMAGMLHVLSGPDHLAAVAPLAASARRQPWREGWGWGLGHTVGVVCVALAGLVLRDVLPPLELISAWSERLVGAALIGIGLWSLARVLGIVVAQHRHDAVAHEHAHLRRGPAWARRLGHPHASFLMGVLHGVAGSAHIVGVVPALALPSTAASLAYLGAFGFGSIAAMVAFAACVGRVRVVRAAQLERRLMTACGALAIAVGTAWMFGASSWLPQ
jgi:sulfite exporter TauE/SafE